MLTKCSRRVVTSVSNKITSTTQTTGRNFCCSVMMRGNNLQQQEATSATTSTTTEDISTSPIVNNQQEDVGIATQEKKWTIGNTSIDFTKVDLYYDQVSSWQLLKTYSALTSCRLPGVRTIGAEILERGGPVVSQAVKYSYFPYFCGGETLPKTKKVIIDVTQNKKMHCILDYSVEGPVQPLETSVISVDSSEVVEDSICKVIAESIEFMGEQNRAMKRDGTSEPLPCPFGVVKVTGISSCVLLERLSKILCYVQLFPESENAKKLLNTNIYFFGDIASDVSTFDLMKEYTVKQYPRTVAFNLNESTPPEPLSPVELTKLGRVIQRLTMLCDACVKNGMSLLVDAEQTYYQAAIDQLYMMMSIKYNNKEILKNRQTPVVYNTYQMYLKDALHRLQFDYHFLTQNGLHHGSKLVRGAYMKSETLRSNEMGIPYPFQQTLLETHVSYVRGVEFCLDNLYSEGNLGVLICSHNQDTLGMSSRLLTEKYGFDKKDPRVMFAQLYGMGDNLSHALVYHGFNVGKYVPFGSVTDVMPYLARRLIENGDMLSGSTVETQRIRSEIARRFAIYSKGVYAKIVQYLEERKKQSSPPSATPTTTATASQ